LAERSRKKPDEAKNDVDFIVVDRTDSGAVNANSRSLQLQVLGRQTENKWQGGRAVGRR